MSFEKYLLLKEDTAFMFNTVKICDKCYECIRMLITKTSQRTKGAGGLEGAEKVISENNDAEE